MIKSGVTEVTRMTSYIKINYFKKYSEYIEKLSLLSLLSLIKLIIIISALEMPIFSGFILYNTFKSYQNDKGSISIQLQEFLIC